VNLGALGLSRLVAARTLGLIHGGIGGLDENAE
jgi:hypothetical protein